MSKRVIHWFTYSVAFALLPLAFGLMFRAIANRPGDTSSTCTELLFFSLMICATSLGDINLITRPVTDLFLQVLHGFLMLGAVGSACLYGGLLMENIAHSSQTQAKTSLLGIAFSLALIFLIFGAISQVFIARIE